MKYWKSRKKLNGKLMIKYMKEQLFIQSHKARKYCAVLMKQKLHKITVSMFDFFGNSIIDAQYCRYNIV